MRIKLLHILWEGIGGAERGVVDLTRNLDPEKYEITVAILSKGGVITDMIDRRKNCIVEFGFSGGLDIRAWFPFFRFLRFNHFDIVINHERTFLVNASLAVAKKWETLVYHEHGMQLLNRSFIELLFYMTWSRIYEVLIAINEDTAKRMIHASKLPSRKLVIIENPVDTDIFSPLLDKSFHASSRRKKLTVGTVARLVLEKDIELFIKSASLIAKHRNDIEFMVVGDGQLKDELEIKALRAGLKGRITFTGETANVPYYLRKFDIFMFTSIYEPFGRTIIEALACEVPVLAAEPLAGGAKDLLKNLPGVKMAEGRNPIDLAKETCHFLDYPMLRGSMGKSGRNHVVAHYDVKKWCSEMDSLYEKILSRRRPEK